jgi:hypothetical protein
VCSSDLSIQRIDSKPKTRKYMPVKSGRLLSGGKTKILLEGQILAAQEMSKSENEVSVRLGVSFMTYRKYAKMYGLYGRVSNKAGIGIDKSIKNEDSGKYPLNHILAGKYPNYSTNRLKVRLIRGKRIENKCNRCGFSEKRISDNTVPILLNYIDGNEKNKLRENLELLCYNCYYLYVNNPFGCKRKFSITEKTSKKSDTTEVIPDVILTEEEIKQIQAPILP